MPQSPSNKTSPPRKVSALRDASLRFEDACLGFQESMSNGLDRLQLEPGHNLTDMCTEQHGQPKCVPDHRHSETAHTHMFLSSDLSLTHLYMYHFSHVDFSSKVKVFFCLFDFFHFQLIFYRNSKIQIMANSHCSFFLLIILSLIIWSWLCYSFVFQNLKDFMLSLSRRDSVMCIYHLVEHQISTSCTVHGRSPSLHSMPCIVFLCRQMVCAQF